ncbi:unnamed protein product [Bubo scandiacus]
MVDQHKQKAVEEKYYMRSSDEIVSVVFFFFFFFRLSNLIRIKVDFQANKKKSAASSVKSEKRNMRSSPIAVHEVFQQ